MFVILLSRYSSHNRNYPFDQHIDKQLPRVLTAALGEWISYFSDYPHGEAREDAAQNLDERTSAKRRSKILYNNPVRFFGEP